MFEHSSQGMAELPDNSIPLVLTSLGSCVATVRRGRSDRDRRGCAAASAARPISHWGVVELTAGWYLLLAVTSAGLALLIGEWAPWATQRLRRHCLPPSDHPRPAWSPITRGPMFVQDRAVTSPP